MKRKRELNALCRSRGKLGKKENCSPGKSYFAFVFIKAARCAHQESVNRNQNNELMVSERDRK